jgi:hypothetical protein
LIQERRVEPEPPGELQESPPPPHSWWVEFEKEDGSIGFPSVVLPSLVWLLLHDREDGSFRSIGDDSFDQIPAAFALSEIYGLTAQASFRKSAQSAVDAMIRLQKPNGSWEGAEPTSWAILALYSARQSDLAVDPAVIDRALRCSSVPGHPGGALARILSKNRPADAAWSLQEESRDRDPLNLAWWYLVSLAMWVQDGARSVRAHMENPGQQWQVWSLKMKEALVPLIRRDGSVEGKSLSDTVVRTSLLQLTLEVYYRYNCVFAPR